MQYFTHLIYLVYHELLPTMTTLVLNVPYPGAHKQQSNMAEYKLFNKPFLITEDKLDDYPNT